MNNPLCYQPPGCFNSYVFRSQLLLLFSLLLPVLPVAQQLQKPINLQTLTVEDGLSQSMVYDIEQDNKGFMWYATFNGLDRYDGNEFVHFRHNDNDSFSISSNQVYRLLVDSKGRLWAGTHNNGLNYFDAAERKWYRFLPGKGVFDIQEDADGGLYVCDDETVIHLSIVPLRGRKKGGTPFRVDITVAKLPFPTPTTITTKGSLYADRHKQVYLTTTFALYSLQFNQPARAIGFTHLYTYHNRWEASPLLEDRNTGKYYLSTTDGLWESADNSFKQVKKIHPAFPQFAKTYIDSKSRFWYNSNGPIDTLNLLTGRSGLFTRLNNPADSTFALLIPMKEDRNGTLWMATIAGGVVTYTDDENHFHTLLPGTYINSVAAIGDSDCLVNNKFILHCGKDSVTMKIQSQEEVNFFNHDIVTRCGKGEGWYVQDTMLVHYNPATGRHTRHAIPYRRLGVPPERHLISGTNTNRISYILFMVTSIIDRDSCLWLNSPFAFAYYNIKEDSFHYIKQAKKTEYFYQDSMGVVWASAEEGIYNYNKATGATGFFARDVNNKIDALPAIRNETGFCDDPLDAQHIIWIGTRNGLYRMNKATGSCRVYNDKDGLPDNLIYSLLADKSGNLWMSTNQGLSCLNAATFSIRNFSEADGLQGREFNTRSALQLKDGTMLFGGTKGLNYFNPADIMPIAPPLTVLTGCRLFGKSSSTETMVDAALPKDIAYASDISISYKDNVVTFTFAGIDYRKKNMLQYRYKLAGFDKEWNYNGGAHEATYTNLDPGDYTFVAAASNTNGIWGKESEPLHVHVLPLWWQTWWFKSLVIIALCALVYAMYSYRLNKALEVERVRNRIARDLHDEIGSTLSAISIYSKVAADQSKNGVVPLLNKIKDNAIQAMEAMSDIVWSVSSKNDDFETVIIHMREHALHLLPLKGYEVDFTVDEKLTGISLNMDKRQSWYLIYKEALNNIAKYAGGTQVWIDIRKEKNNLVLSIKDNGVGFYPGEIKKGNGLQNMHNRAGMAGGKVAVTSNLGQGSEVRVSMPV